MALGARQSARALGTGFALTLLAVGCADGAPSPAQGRITQALDPRVPPTYLDYEDAWIREGCPRFPLRDEPPQNGYAGVWVGAPLFDAKSLDPDHPPRYEPPQSGRLRGYCAFHWEPNPQRPDAFRRYPRADVPTAQLLAQEDADVVSDLEPVPGWDASSALNRPAIVKALRATARTQWDLENVAYELLPRDDRRVRVALVDNGPYGSKGELAPNGAPHVRAVANVVRDIACPDGESGARPCPVRLSAHLALPHVDPATIDWAQGGFFGKRSQVAVAIWDAAMKAGRGTSEEWRLVINLSIGWKVDGPLGAADLAVRDAIAFARCRGHAVIAAAGNREDRFDDTPGPLYPGAFEVERAPTRGACVEQYGASALGPVEGKDDYAPLVFAVGALDATDRPIVATRPLARAPLAAHGHAVMTGDTMPLPPELAPASGSSFATAAVSGVAALVWSVAPQLTAAQVMDVVYQSGLDLRAPSDFQLAPGSQPDRPSVHRLSMCRAVLIASGYSPDHCTGTPAPYAGRQRPINRMWITPPSDVGASVALSPVEVADWIALGGDNVVVAPWAGPQPTSPGCSTCRLINAASSGSGADELEVSLTPEMLAQAANTKLVITVEGPSGSTTHTVEPPAGVRNFTVPLGTKDPVDQATLTFRHVDAAGTFDTYEQVLVQ